VVFYRSNIVYSFLYSLHTKNDNMLSITA
jgi:hypothetical protein